MSSTSFSTRRQIWSNQHPLRKQRSFIDNSGLLLAQASSSGGGGINLGRSERSKYSLLQKQYSVDQVYAKGSSRQGRFNVLSTTSCGSSNSVNNKESVVVVNKSIVARQWPIADDDTSEISLSSLTVKKKPQTKGYGDIKKDKVVGDRLKKSPKGNGDDKINLNIFLAQTTTTENDGVSSDIDSPSESFDNLNKDTKIPATQNPQLIKKSNIIQAKPSPPPAAARRSQFQASRALESSSVTPAALISASPSLTIERRPPLVRAMSAPIRTLDENSKNILANKRKSRRRKVLGRAPNCDKPNVNVIESSIDENEEIFGDKGRGKNKKSCGRTRSNLGCDVVTLVSLISSEGSDSEKEDSISPSEGPIKRAPLLRKAGKSVSFQEDDSPHFGQGKEISHLLRRGSVAPLAARIRANRPPTAPPVSIFLTDFENSGSKMSDESKTARKDDNPTSSPSTSDTKENNGENNPEGGNDNQFPDYVNTMKERECWKLFQKMLNKGVAVSYDTILRGMLTPTELRLIQKQKELQESKKLAESIEIVEEEKN